MENCTKDFKNISLHLYIHPIFADVSLTDKGVRRRTHSSISLHGISSNARLSCIRTSSPIPHVPPPPHPPFPSNPGCSSWYTPPARRARSRSRSPHSTHQPTDPQQLSIRGEINRLPNHLFWPTVIRYVCILCGVSSQIPPFIISLINRHIINSPLHSYTDQGQRGSVAGPPIATTN